MAFSELVGQGEKLNLPGQILARQELRIASLVIRNGGAKLEKKPDCRTLELSMNFAPGKALTILIVSMNQKDSPIGQFSLFGDIMVDKRKGYYKEVDTTNLYNDDGSSKFNYREPGTDGKFSYSKGMGWKKEIQAYRRYKQVLNIVEKLLEENK